MSKKLKDLQWQSVAVEGFPVSISDNFQGFVGLEECTSYGLDKESKKLNKKKEKNKPKAPSDTENTKKKRQKKRKTPSESEHKAVSNKKIKLDNGFIVESCDNSITPSQTNEVSRENDKQKSNKGTENKKIIKPKLGEDISQTVSELTAEDMLTWAEFKLQEPIMKALTELGFKVPTKIQQLSLPAAIHGRRDILGAAETGSGKTLAFGLPILSGILKLKEKAQAKNLDVYDIPYRKTWQKKKDPQSKEDQKEKFKKKKVKKDFSKNKMEADTKAKESSEDGYSTGDDTDDDGDDDNSNDENSEANVEALANDVSNIKMSKRRVLKSNDDYLEEIEIPVKKRDTNSADEGNDSDDDNYTHLSDMLDSDELSESSDDNDETVGNDESVENDDDGNDSGDDNEDEVESDDDEENDDVESNDDDEESGVDEESDVELGGVSDEGEEGNETAGGMGCVKVVDDIEIPDHVVVKTGKPLYALILTPTRELAMQISRHLIAVAKYTGIKIATIVGGMAAVKQERVLRSGPEVVVATPGRLWELITQGQPHLQQLDSVKFLAIDETDRMIERGHFEELHPLLERLNADAGRRSARQNFVFSATLTMVHDLPTHMKGKKVTKRGKILNRKVEKMTPQQKIKRLVDKIGMTDPKVVDITTTLGTAETLTECRITCTLEHKDAYLYYILKRHPGRTIVFCNSIGSVRRLAQLLTILKCRPLPLHASMPQRQRLKNLERFRDDAHGVLIATDVAARGLDVPGVDNVVQYQVPRTAENYVHRSGRTARARREGICVLMVEPAEAYLYSKLCNTLNKTSEVPTFPVAAHILTPFKEVVGIARELDALELRKRRAAQARGWREKAAQDMDMIIDDDDVPVQLADPSIDKALKAKRRQLDRTLSRPMFPRGFSFKYPTLNEPAALSYPEENALQVMKKALESGQLKKEKRKSKNAPLLTLGKDNKKFKNKKNFKKKKNKK